MTMLLLVFRHSLDEEMLQLLKEMDVKFFTEAPKVFGMGEAGTAFNSIAWPGSNCMIPASMEGTQAAQVIERHQVFRDQLAAQERQAKTRWAFSIPCEQLN